jgi:hypothetical protein
MVAEFGLEKLVDVLSSHLLSLTSNAAVLQGALPVSLDPFLVPPSVLRGTRENERSCPPVMVHAAP